ncbi:DUF3899 domain-containing protein [Bacillaceae bacterium SIJ1]|uniref:DUF3899 domain-containing protein n=1 Tax=Litoribacterium kuwaitense TaxID=1398745 RepID=UPI0013EBEC36|nr:DUF3899 domain-containing protein [Litoribacterium kuwaitense]NGP44864.1 DUF3899 domain-containing protein [Litoribacterium kuwaitense]
MKRRLLITCIITLLGTGLLLFLYGEISSIMLSNALFIVTLVYLSAAIILHVIGSGFFDGFTYGYKKLRKHTSKTEQLIENDDTRTPDFTGTKPTRAKKEWMYSLYIFAASCFFLSLLLIVL